LARACASTFRDIGHDEQQHDVTYENAQARERTQILMDVANQVGGLVVGTGDLSEAALGWMTFNGDHMSMYHVNAGVPKTLVRYLVAWCADELFTGETTEVLRSIVDTPITPELLPLDANEQLAQKTEETIGPYDLHDFLPLSDAAPPVWAGQGLLPGAPGLRRRLRRRPRSCAGRRSSIGASSASSSSVRPCPTAPRWAAWRSPRAGTGACPATRWLRCGWWSWRR
jgi:hypothetical protein